MKTFTYLDLVSMASYYLEKYPSVAVALECVLEDVEGDGETAKEVLSALNRVNEGEADYVVLADWANKVGSRDLETFAQRIEEGHKKGLDIGYYVKRVMPGSALHSNKEVKFDKDFKDKRNHKEDRFGKKGQKPYKKDFRR